MLARLGQQTAVVTCPWKGDAVRDQVLLDEGHAGFGARGQDRAVELAEAPADGVPALIVREDQHEVRRRGRLGPTPDLAPGRDEAGKDSK
jgi:hypothetical protein